MQQVDELSLDDLGIEGRHDGHYFRHQREGEEKLHFGITESAIMQSEDYALLLFFIEKGQGLPLHDHQDMTVYTRVLTGSFRYRALDKPEHEDYEKDEKSVSKYY